MNELTMYMVTHKAVDYIPAGRTPIFVGNGDNRDNYISDATDDNISDRNKNYCELTALYWIWKNDKRSKFVSIEHYRRFFMKRNNVLPIIYKDYEINKLLDKYDVVTSRLYDYGPSVREYYRGWHFEEDLNAVERAIKQRYPEYAKTFTGVMDSHRIPMFNMMATDKEHFDSYCEWLFNLLFMASKDINLTGRTDFQQRAYGFLAERMMEVWIRYNNLKVYRAPVFYLQDSYFKSFLVSEKRRIPTTFTPTIPRH